ncbi:MAG: SDR family oxidoreductase [Gammaproteobacteria bacterium]
MQLQDSRIILTGASSGIGRALARRLADGGARLLLIGRRQEALSEVCTALGEGHHTLAADISTVQGRRAAVDTCQAVLGGVDVLINNAGISSYALFDREDPALSERIIQTNLMAPVALTRQVLPIMLAQGRGRIVNIGSVFGGIGFACFASYSASKFGLRGFSEALRRELEGSGVGVTYVAPRATKTAINSPTVYRMMAALKMNLDTPEQVAMQISAALVAERKERCLGWPEKLFVRINALWPRLVDKALRGQTREMKRILQEMPDSED